MKVRVTKKAARKIRQGYPLIQIEDLQKELTGNLPTDWVIFEDEQQELGRGYLGKQNKGLGWVLTTQRESINETFFYQRFLQAKTNRQVLFSEQETTAFRLVNGEGDQLGGLTIDWYDHFAVFSWYNDTLRHHQDLILTAFKAAFPEVRGAYEKIRYKVEGTPLAESTHLYGEVAPEPLVIKENGVHYATYLNDGLMTGIFLDQKEVRGKLTAGFAAGKRVLNMFSYTGAFSVAAAMGGAIETTSVDLANRSRSKTSEQFAVNGIDSAKQIIQVMDTFEYFKYAKRKEKVYDLIILDPPSFARNKKKVFSVTKNYGELIEQSLAILAPKGWIIASTNAANLSLEKFENQIEQAFQKQQVAFRKVETYRLPADFAVDAQFEEGNYLKVIFYQKQA